MTDMDTHTREGDSLEATLLDDLHGDMCNGGQEYSSCRPVSLGENTLTVVYMAWCGDCGAAAWEIVA